MLSKSDPVFRAPFLLSFGLGVIFMEPWTIAAWQELGLFAVMVVMLALPVAAGCIIGGVTAVVTVSIGMKLRQYSRR